MRSGYKCISGKYRNGLWVLKEEKAHIRIQDVYMPAAETYFYGEAFYPQAFE